MGPDPGAPGACARLAPSLPVDAFAVGVALRLLTPTSREATRKLPIMVQYEYLNHIPPPGGLSEPSGITNLRLLQNQVNTRRKWVSTVFGRNWSDLLSNTQYQGIDVRELAGKRRRSAGRCEWPRDDGAWIPACAGMTGGEVKGSSRTSCDCPGVSQRRQRERTTRSRYRWAGLSRERPERRGGRSARFRGRRRGREPTGNRRRGRRRPGAFVPKGRG